MGCPSPPIYGFIHVARMNHWRDVLFEQAKKIVNSGLWDRASKIYLGVLGEGENLDFLGDFLQKVEVVYHGPNLLRFEYPTLALLHDVACEEECYVWYSHLKGVSACSRNPGSEDWRRRMELLVHVHWFLCVETLAYHRADVVGIMLGRWERMWMFCGNFWWSHSGYLRCLPPLSVFNQADRYRAENWVCLYAPSVYDYSEKCGRTGLVSISDRKRFYEEVLKSGWGDVFDEDYYLRAVASAKHSVEGGIHKSGYEYFIEQGYFAGDPFRMSLPEWGVKNPTIALG